MPGTQPTNNTPTNNTPTGEPRVFRHGDGKISRAFQAATSWVREHTPNIDEGRWMRATTVLAAIGTLGIGAMGEGAPGAERLASIAFTGALMGWTVLAARGSFLPNRKVEAGAAPDGAANPPGVSERLSAWKAKQAATSEAEVARADAAADAARVPPEKMGPWGPRP